VVGVKPVPDLDIHKYGIIASAGERDGIHKVTSLVEKPSFCDAPSNLAIMGRYILEPSIFPVLETIRKGAGGEYQLTDAMHAMCGREGMMALELRGKRYDIGDKIGYMKAIIEIGLQREELYPVLMPYLNDLVCRAGENVNMDWQDEPEAHATLQ
jgi:UTP--glucose-1-phosphate uridylyltransferase